MSGMRGDRYRTSGWHCECCSGYLPLRRVDEKRQTIQEVHSEIQARFDEVAAAIKALGGEQ